MHGHVRVKKREAFLANLRLCGLVSEAAKQTGVARHTPYGWAKQSDTFAKDFEEAKQIGGEALADKLEAALESRATEGWEDAVFYKGAQVGSRKLFSDTAAIFLLKGLRPHRYMEQLVGVSVGGQQVIVNVKSFTSLPTPSSASLPEPTPTPTEDASVKQYAQDPA